MRKMETKDFPFILTKLDEEEGTFSGYASVWDVVDAFGDVVLRGAFKRTLKNKKQFPILWSHNIMEPIGIITNGQEDEKGLLVEGRLTKGVQRADEVRSNMKAKAVNGLSIGYQTVREENDKESGVRNLKEVNLWEVSLCVFQACPGALVEDIKAIVPEEGKPYPNEHACRLRDPGDFQGDSFRRVTRKHEGKEYSVIMGRLKDENTMTEQAYRYAKDIWTAAEARTHCKDHDGSFEAASGKCEECRYFENALSNGDPDSSTPSNRDTSNPELIHLLDELRQKITQLGKI